MERRQVLRAFGYGAGIAGSGVIPYTISGASAAEFGVKVITVGAGGDFATPQAAIDSITDASSTNRYVVILLPGVHNSFTMKRYVSVEGYGINSSIVNTRWGESIYAASDATLSNLKVLYSGSNGATEDSAAIRNNTIITNFVLRDVEIEVSGIAGASGQRWGILSGNNIFNYTAYNIRIITEGGGISTGYGHNFFHGVDIWLTGSGIGLPHVGIRQLRGNRVEFFGGRISTGYFVPELSGAQGEDVVCVYVPDYNTEMGSRLSMFGTLMFARNPNALSAVNVNCIRAENGWVRTYACFGQSETESNIHRNPSRTVYSVYRTGLQPSAGAGGRVETYGCRFSGNNGNLHGGQNLNVCHYNNSHHGIKLVIGEGGVALCDASTGAFSLNIHSSRTAPYGEEFVFKKTDPSGNAVSIIPTGGFTIDGLPAYVLSSQYDYVRVIWDGSNWFRI